MVRISKPTKIVCYLFYNDFPSINSDCVVVSVFIGFLVNSKQDTPFHRIAYDYSRADGDGLRDHLRDVSE